MVRNKNKKNKNKIELVRSLQNEEKNGKPNNSK
jgi:hypothetical protein